MSSANIKLNAYMLHAIGGAFAACAMCMLANKIKGYFKMNLSKYCAPGIGCLAGLAAVLGSFLAHKLS